MLRERTNSSVFEGNQHVSVIYNIIDHIYLLYI